MATGDDLLNVMQRLLLAQQHQTAMLEKFIDRQDSVPTTPNDAQTAQAAKTDQWKAANPELANRCAAASKILDIMQTDLVDMLTEAIEETNDANGYGRNEFMVMELMDKFGSRVAHLHNLRTMLLQLSST
jgi:hypothetical protein